MNSKATPYKQINVNNIISVEGERSCQDNLTEVSPLGPTIT